MEDKEIENLVENSLEEKIPKDILKIQKKLATFEKGSRNYKKYIKILAKHIKNNNMKNRLNSNIKTIEVIQDISGY